MKVWSLLLLITFILVCAFTVKAEESEESLDNDEMLYSILTKEEIAILRDENIPDSEKDAVWEKFQNGIQNMALDIQGSMGNIKDFGFSANDLENIEAEGSEDWQTDN